MSGTIIFAPHVDDEVIGCWGLLNADEEPAIVAYCSKLVGVRRVEAVNAAKTLGFIMKQARGELPDFIRNVIVSLSIDGICWAPDPHWELHPLHKLVGILVRETCASQGVRFGTYSTNMNAPYIRALTPARQAGKRVAMESLYPSQRELWKSDHKYFLFEGRAEWNPPVA